MFDNAEVEEFQKTIEVMPHVKHIQFEWYISSNYHLVNKYLPLFPARSKYDLSMDLNLKTDPYLDEKLRMINWNDKRIYSIECGYLQQLSVIFNNKKTI